MSIWNQMIDIPDMDSGGYILHIQSSLECPLRKRGIDRIQILSTPCGRATHMVADPKPPDHNTASAPCVSGQLMHISRR